jgi:uncharacterized membrane protein
MDIDIPPLDPQELENDIVTVSQVQIAFSATVSQVQTRLSDLSLQADTSTVTGLYDLMQQTLTVILDHADAWTHLRSHSQTVDAREAAEQVFIQLSEQAQGQFQVATLSNVDGVLQQQPLSGAEPEAPPAYIVVTLLLGTADDRPLFATITTAAELRQALEAARAMPLPYLMVFEVLWTPQHPQDSLTAADFAQDFADLQALDQSERPS